jgi:hypothetical protein
MNESFPPNDRPHVMVFRILTAFSVFIITWIVSSCSPNATGGNTVAFNTNPLTATSSPTPSVYETHVPSTTLTQTQTLTKTNTLSPTQTPSATLFPRPSSIGPYLALYDTSGPPSITFFSIGGSDQSTIDLPVSIHNIGYPFSPSVKMSPDWKWYAYVTGQKEGMVLRVLNLITGSVLDIAKLVPEGYALNESTYYLFSIAWSPDGRYLAYIEVMENDKFILSVFDVDTGNTQRIENGSAGFQSIYWSPDGQWILFLKNAVRWAVRRDGTESKQLPGPSFFISWLSDYEYIAIEEWSHFSCFSGTTVVNIQAGSSFEIFKRGTYCPSPVIAVDPKSRLMAAYGYVACGGELGCSIADNTGLYFGSIYGKLQLVTKSQWGDAPRMTLDSRGGTGHAFIWINSGFMQGITPEGIIDTIDIESNGFMISPNYWMASFPENGIKVYDPADKLRYKLDNISLYSIVWDTNSRGLFYHTLDAIYYWSVGDPTPRLIVSCPGVSPWGDIFIATNINLRTLPNLRILPTRADKPAEGTSIWTRTAYKEMFQPGSNRYNITVPAYSSWRWSFSLGTTDSKIFEKILLPEDVQFLINGEKIDTNMFRMSDKTAEGRFSRAWATTLSGWRSGDKAELEILYTLHSAVTDGNVTYPAGEYRQIISLVVE